MKKRPLIYWGILFGIIILLTQDYLFFKWSNKLSLLGLPSWLAWFTMLHILFLMGFYFFSEKYWKE